jgi:FtsH-binding integral membrane protein
MPLLTRVFVTLCLLAVFAFCVLGVVATSEQPGFPMMRVAYSIACVACLVAGVYVLTRRRRES